MNLLQQILKAGEDDWIDLSEVTYLTAGVIGIEHSDGAVIAFTNELVGYLLRKGWFIVGDLGGVNGFRKWEVSLAEAIAKIERDWRSLGRPIALSDVCWFAITEEGLKLVRTIPE